MKGQAAGAADIMILIESYHDPRWWLYNHYIFRCDIFKMMMRKTETKNNIK
jgi:hypothetical protein